MNIIFLGCPGSGKGTQAKMLEAKHNFYHLSTGDLFREEISKKSDLGLKAKSYIDAGKLVPDAVVLDVIKNKIKDIKSDILFDGFPRTIEQAEGLEKIMEELLKVIDMVFFFEVNEKEVINRITARRNCPKCGRIYNMITSPPKNDESCDDCNVKLNQRDDDKEEVVKKRMQVYKDQTSPLISYYRMQGIFHIIDASKTVDNVYLQIVNILSKK